MDAERYDHLYCVERSCMHHLLYYDGLHSARDVAYDAGELEHLSVGLSACGASCVRASRVADSVHGESHSAFLNVTRGVGLTWKGANEVHARFACSPVSQVLWRGAHAYKTWRIRATWTPSYLAEYSSHAACITRVWCKSTR